MSIHLQPMNGVILINNINPTKTRNKFCILLCYCFLYRYVANPSKVLGELLASGQPTPEIVEGEILAGDFTDAKVDVLTELRA